MNCVQNILTLMHPRKILQPIYHLSPIISFIKYIYLGERLDSVSIDAVVAPASIPSVLSFHKKNFDCRKKQY